MTCLDSSIITGYLNEIVRILMLLGTRMRPAALGRRVVGVYIFGEDVLSRVRGSGLAFGCAQSYRT